MADYKIKGSDRSDNARIKYQVAINKNVSESEIQWSRYNAMLVFNSILIAVIGFIYDDMFAGGPVLKERLLFWLPLFGLATCFLWLMMTIRGFQWMNYWIRSARKIEETYLRDECNELNPVSEGNENRNCVIGWPKTALGSYILVILIAGLYLAFWIK